MAQNNGQTNSSHRKNDFIPFYFSDFVKGIRRYWALIAVLTIVFGGVTYIRGRRSYSPQYTTSATFTISTSTGTGRTDGGMTSYSFYYDNATSTQLATAFPFILSSNILQDAVCEELNLTSLPARLSASSVSGSNMFTITCVGSDPQQVYDIIRCTIDKCPEAARYIVGKIKFTMITNPYIPTSPSNKNSYVRDALKMGMIGAFIGLAWVLVYCVSRKTVRTRDEVNDKLGIKDLGTLPQVRFKRYKQKIDRSVLWTNKNVGRGFMESLRLLRNNLVHDLKPEEKAIIVTSTAPGEGKTTVTVNIAMAVADLGKKVLLVDWDIRNPSVLEMLDIEPKKEDENADIGYRIIHVEKYGISILYFTSRKNYWKRMRAEFVQEIIDKLRSSYDLIFIDTPPCGLISDTVVIAQCADAAVYVVLQDAVRVSRIRVGIDLILNSDVRIIGCVFNGAESGLTGYGDNYGYSKYNYYGKYGYGYGGYGYGYGYGYGGSSKAFSLRHRIKSSRSKHRHSSGSGSHEKKDN
ncbi:MAG: P-loop NTPase [Clostridia bacterium]|nr:P-loop NTPase [Clostridia bacterium]